MKKIVLVSVILGLLTYSANATYYKTSTNNCSDANMMATLDNAVAVHRAVITEVTCDYTVPEKPAPVVKKPAPVAKPAPVVKHKPRKMAAKHYVHHKYSAPAQAPVVTYEPTIVIVSQTTETCTCFDCGC